MSEDRLSRDLSFVDLIEAARLTYHPECVEKDGWNGMKSDPIRGDLLVIDMPSSHYPEDRAAAVARESQRLGRPVHLANARELAKFASTTGPAGWNRRDRIVAFGSRCVPPGDDPRPYVAGVWGNDSHARLALALCIGLYDSQVRVLCVVE